MTEFKRDGGPAWPTRLLRFNPYEWTEDEIWEAAEHYALRHAEASGLDEPLPADRWENHLTPQFAYTHFRLRWARENGREQDLVDEMIENRLRRQQTRSLLDG